VFQGSSPNTGGPKTDHTVATAAGTARLFSLIGKGLFILGKNNVKIVGDSISSV